MSTSKSVNTEHRTQLFIYVSEFVRFHSIFIFFWLYGRTVDRINILCSI